MKSELKMSGILDVLKMLMGRLSTLPLLDKSDDFRSLRSDLCGALRSVDPKYLPEDRLPSFLASRRRLCSPDVVSNTSAFHAEILRMKSVLSAYREGVTYNRNLESILIRYASGDDVDLEPYSPEDLYFHIKRMAVQGLIDIDQPSNGQYSGDIVSIKLSEKGKRRLGADSPDIHINALTYVRRFEMGDIYQGNTGGQIGRNNTATDVRVEQHIGSREDDLNFVELSKELARLRAEMRSRGVSPAEDVATGAIAAAQQAADKGDKLKVLENLKTAGKWALDVAKELAVPVAESALKNALGLGS